jgi:hypothetical protein
MTESIILKGTSGLNNIIDPLRHPYNPETGVGFLAEAVNIDIDDTGGISRRAGQVLLQSGNFHSLFCDKGDCFVVQDRADDAAIYKVGTDYSLSGVRSGLTKGARVSFCQVGAKTFYVNGHQNGVIENGISSAHPISTYTGPDVISHFSQAPVGEHLTYALNRLWVAMGNVIYCSEPFKLGLFRLSSRFFQFGTRIRMICAVANGVWISDSESTGFIAFSEKWEGLKYNKNLDIPSHEWSDNCKLVDLSRTSLQINGLSAVWSNDAGLHIGTEDGKLINLTDKNLIYPSGSSGSVLVETTFIVNNIY